MLNCDVYSFLALGDSYTVGTGISVHDSWPTQLVKRVRCLGYAMGDAKVVAQNGWTTQDLKDGMRKGFDQTFNLVTLLIGVNNQYRGDDPSTFARDFKEILGEAIRIAGDQPAYVFALSIPDWGVSPYAVGMDANQIAMEIDAYNQIVQGLSSDAGVPYVDITPLTRRHAGDAAMFAADGLHPSGQAYAAWVECLIPRLAPVLRKV